MPKHQSNQHIVHKLNHEQMTNEEKECLYAHTISKRAQSHLQLGSLSQEEFARNVRQFVETTPFERVIKRVQPINSIKKEIVYAYELYPLPESKGGFVADEDIEKFQVYLSIFNNEVTARVAGIQDHTQCYSVKRFDPEETNPKSPAYLLQETDNASWVVVDYRIGMTNEPTETTGESVVETGIITTRVIDLEAVIDEIDTHPELLTQWLDANERLNRRNDRFGVSERNFSEDEARSVYEAWIDYIRPFYTHPIYIDRETGRTYSLNQVDMLVHLMTHDIWYDFSRRVASGELYTELKKPLQFNTMSYYPLKWVAELDTFLYRKSRMGTHPWHYLKTIRFVEQLGQTMHYKEPEK